MIVDRWLLESGRSSSPLVEGPFSLFSVTFHRGKFPLFLFGRSKDVLFRDVGLPVSLDPLLFSCPFFSKLKTLQEEQDPLY